MKKIKKARMFAIGSAMVVLLGIRPPIALASVAMGQYVARKK